MNSRWSSPLSWTWTPVINYSPIIPWITYPATRSCKWNSTFMLLPWISYVASKERKKIRLERIEFEFSSSMIIRTIIWRMMRRYGDYSAVNGGYYSTCVSRYKLQRRITGCRAKKRWAIRMIECHCWLQLIRGVLNKRFSRFDDGRLH